MNTAGVISGDWENPPDTFREGHYFTFAGYLSRDSPPCSSANASPAVASATKRSTFRPMEQPKALCYTIP